MTYINRMSSAYNTIGLYHPFIPLHTYEDHL